MTEYCKHRDSVLFVGKFVGECGAQLIRSITQIKLLALSWGFQAEINQGFWEKKKVLKKFKGEYLSSLEFQQTALRNYLLSNVELEHIKLPSFFICNFS